MEGLPSLTHLYPPCRSRRLCWGALHRSGFPARGSQETSSGIGSSTNGSGRVTEIRQRGVSRPCAAIRGVQWLTKPLGCLRGAPPMQGGHVYSVSLSVETAKRNGEFDFSVFRHVSLCMPTLRNDMKFTFKIRLCPCWLSVSYIVVCICEPQTPNLSLPQFPLW